VEIVSNGECMDGTEVVLLVDKMLEDVTVCTVVEDVFSVMIFNSE
jgi:hypothetical protein